MASLHRFVSWWLAPQLAKSGDMYLVKLLQPVPKWRSDGHTYRAVSPALIPVRICQHGANANHPECGKDFLARPRDLVAVQVGVENN